MTTPKKEQERQLKQPDPVQARLVTMLDWILKNTRLLGLAAVPVALVAAGAYGYQYFQVKQRDARVEELGKVQLVWDAEQRKANDQRQALAKKIEEIDAKMAAAAKPAEAPAAGGEAAPAAPVLDPKLADEKAALERQINAIKGDHTASLAQFQEFHKKHPSSPEGWMAGMTAARLLIEQGKFAEARPLLDEILTQSKDNDFYQIQSRLALLGVLEELGDYDQGLQQVEALEKLVDKELQPKLLLARGRLQMLKNVPDEAKKTFASLIEQHGATPEAQKARSIQALLN